MRRRRDERFRAGRTAGIVSLSSLSDVDDESEIVDEEPYAWAPLSREFAAAAGVDRQRKTPLPHRRRQ